MLATGCSLDYFQHMDRFHSRAAPRPHMGREWIGPLMGVCLRRPAGPSFSCPPVRSDQIEPARPVWVAPVVLHLLMKGFRCCYPWNWSNIQFRCLAQQIETKGMFGSCLSLSYQNIGNHSLAKFLVRDFLTLRA
jgi:hypothetical protein